LPQALGHQRFVASTVMRFNFRGLCQIGTGMSEFVGRAIGT
jgi:hypothetical protein